MTIKNYKICPYCKNVVLDTDTVCPKCKNSLVIKCPYCKEEINAYDEVCPHCTSKITRRKEPKFTLILGPVLYVMWLIINALIALGITAYPKMLTEKDKDGALVFGVEAYIPLVLEPLLIITIPYVIAAVKKYKLPIAVTGIIINLISGIAFIAYFIYLQYEYVY